MCEMRTGTKGIAMLIKALKETSALRKEMQKLRKDMIEMKAKEDTFSSLTTWQKGLLRKRCRESLCKAKKKSIAEWFCFPTIPPKQKTAHPIILDLIAEIKSRYLEEPSIFRNEGDRNLYRKVVDMMVNGEEIDFSDYRVLVLGSALKSYIRDHMDGFFDMAVMKPVIDQFSVTDMKKSERLCKCLVFSMNPIQRKVFTALQDLFQTISANKDKTRMSMESICNIFCLTLTPQEAFKSIEVIPVLAKFFKVVMECNMEDIRGFEHFTVYE